MARKPTGQVITKKGRRGTTFAIRFRAYSKRHYLTLGTGAEDWTKTKAESELANVMADVRRGIWRPAETETVAEPQVEPDFHTFASDWFARRELEGLKPRTLEYLRWALSDHLLPHLHKHKLSEITPQAIDHYSAAKVTEGRLSNSSINKTITVLASVLALGVEYGHIPSNPAVGRRRKLPTTQVSRAYLEPAQVEILLVGAAELDAADHAGRRYRRPLLATLAFAGLRVGELLALRWQDIDLSKGTISVREAKTAAGVRSVDIQPELREDLILWKATTSFAAEDDFVFPTGLGRADNRNNVRQRVLLRAVRRANQQLAAKGRRRGFPMACLHMRCGARSRPFSSPPARTSPTRWPSSATRIPR